MTFFINFFYEPKVAKELGNPDTWLNNDRKKTAAGGYVEEMLGTFFWIFLASQIEFFGLGEGYRFGVAWIIVSTVFAGQFNSLDTILRAVHGGDYLDSLVRLVAQAAAGFLGVIVFNYLGLIPEGTDLNGSNTMSHKSFDIMNWVWLFLTFLVYYFAKSQLQADNQKSIPGWFGNILLFGLTFAVAQDGFLFAPNRVFFVGTGDIVGVLASFWYVYLAYAVTAFLAAYVLHVLPSVCGMKFEKDNFALPKYEPLSLQN